MALFLFLFVLLAGAAAAQTPGCPPRDLGVNASATGELTASDCRFRDLIKDSKNANYVDAYRVAVTERAVVSVRASSGEFSPVVHVCDALLRCLAQKDGQLTISLQPGVYFLLATSKSFATGAYSIETHAEAPRSCAVTDLAFDQPANGSFTAGGCRWLDIASPSYDESYVQQYRIRLLRPGVVTLEMASSALATVLGVYDRRGSRIAFVQGRNKASRIQVSLDAGTYTVMAGSGDIDAGSFTLKGSLEALRPCPVIDLTLETAVDGAFTTADCRILDLWLYETDATYVQQYRVTAPERTVLTVDMTSNTLDTYLLVLDETGEEVIGDNDDADSTTTDARVVASLTPGTYLIWANVSRAAAGSYTLRTSLEAPHTCDVVDLGVSDAVQGKLHSGGCRVLDLVAPSGDASPVQIYKTVVPRTGVLKIDMESGEFDNYLLMVPECCDMTWEDNDSGGGTNARIELLLTPGTYYVLASTMENTGAYALRTEFNDPRACAIADAQPNGLVEGALADGDCRLRDVLPGATEDLRVNLFRLTPPRSGAVRASATSPDFEPLVVIMDAQYRVMAPDLTYGTGDPAVAIASLRAEPYTIVVATLDGNTGKYSLRTEFQ